MRLTGFMRQNIRPRRRRTSDKNPATETYSKDQKSKLVVFEMTLHVPCHVAGKTTSGARWEGKTKTVALSSFGARLLIPADVDLEEELSILFRIPPALETIFRRHAFRVKAEIRPSSADGHWPTPSGQKVICVAFSHPLRFPSWPTREEKNKIPHIGDAIFPSDSLW